MAAGDKTGGADLIKTKTAPGGGPGAADLRRGGEAFASTHIVPRPAKNCKLPGHLTPGEAELWLEAEQGYRRSAILRLSPGEEGSEMTDENQELLELIERIPEEHRSSLRQKLVTATYDFQKDIFRDLPDAPPHTLADLDHILPKIMWLWRPWLPKGFVTLLVGEPGAGKSALALAIAKAVITGASWPDKTAGDGGGYVVWAETESSHAILRERATDWKIPKDKLILPAVGDDLLTELRLDTEEGWWAVQKEVHRDGVRLVILDSLRGAFRGSEDRSDIIGLISQLAELAMRTHVPVLGVHHLRKRGLLDNGRVELDRVRGSSAIVQLARCVWAVDRPDQLTPDVIRLQQIKNNLARWPDSCGFKITQEGVIFTDAPTEPKESTQRDKAADLLLALLRGGPMLATEIFAEGEGAALSKETLKRAKKALGIIAKREDNRWWWALPTKEE